jgi:hypothetical protein
MNIGIKEITILVSVILIILSVNSIWKQLKS